MRSCLAFLICLGTVAPSVYADHFAGGTISTRCVGNNFHEVTLQLFIDCSGADLLPQQLAFSNSCGVVFTLNGLQPVDVVEVSSLCPSEIENSTCNGGSLPGYRLLTYRTTTYLSPCAEWVISWMTCCRQQSLNLLGGPGIYVETVLNNLGGTCNEAPSFVNNRIPLVCLGQAVTHDIHAIEGDGNALRYEFIDARFGNPGPLPLQYASGYTGTEPFTGMTIDPITGLISFTPTLSGSIIVVVKITETDSTGAMISTVMRDMLFVVTACSNQPPTADGGEFISATGSATIAGPRQLQVCGTGQFCSSFTISDPDPEQQINLTSDIAMTMAGATLETTGSNPVEVNLCWAFPTPGSYVMGILAEDDACPYIGSRMYTYTITVGNAPEAGQNASVNICENALPFQLVDSLGGTPASGGQWVDPEGNISNGMFTPGLSLPGIHTYTVGVPGCSNSAVISVVIQPSSAPECLTAGVVDQEIGISYLLVPDQMNDHRFLLSAADMFAEVSVLSSDGRLITTQRMQLHRNAPAVIEIPRHHHGLAIVRVQGLSNGAHFASRVMVP